MDLLRRHQLRNNGSGSRDDDDQRFNIMRFRDRVAGAGKPR